MTFYVHSPTPKPKNKLATGLLVLSYGIMGCLLLMGAIVTSLETKSVAPAVLILLPITVCTTLLVILIRDLAKAYVEFDEVRITAVDYWFCIKKEMHFTVQDVAAIEITRPSRRTRGPYAISGRGALPLYIVFRNAEDRYLFKILYTPQTQEHFESFFGLKAERISYYAT